MAEFVKIDGATTWTAYDDGSITAVVEETGGAYVSGSDFILVRAEDIADYENMIIYTPEDDTPYTLRLSGIPDGYNNDPLAPNYLAVVGYKGDATTWITEPPETDIFDLQDYGNGAETGSITGPVSIVSVSCSLTTLPSSSITITPSLIVHYANDDTPETNTVTVSYRQGRL